MRKYNWLKGKSVEEISQINDGFWNHLAKEAYPVSKGKMRIPISLEPFVITKEEYVGIERSLTNLVSAAQKLANAYFIDEELREVIVINPEELGLINKFQDEDLTGIVRVDLFYGKKPFVVEINADFPDGYFMHDVTVKKIASMTGTSLGGESHAELFHGLLKGEGLGPDDNIFIGYDKGRLFVDEFVLTGEVLEKMGWKNVKVGTFEDLEFIDSKPYYEGIPIDIIRRGAELFKLRKVPGLLDNLARSTAGSGVKVVNNFKMRVLGHKSLMAALHDERFHHYLTKQEVGAVRSVLPKTYKLDKFDLREANREKDRWVLKPSDLAEGEGVSVGKSMSKSDWELSLNRAWENGEYWILQERVEVPSAQFTLFDVDENNIIVGDKKYDFDPHMIMYKDRIEMGHILVRFSESDILNVMKGGGLTYVLVE